MEKQARHDICTNLVSDTISLETLIRKVPNCLSTDFELGAEMKTICKDSENN